MIIIVIVQDIDTSSVRTVLGSVIGVLIVFIGAMYMYFKNELKVYRDDLKDERLYIRGEGEKNITALLENNKVLERLSSSIENTSQKVADIKNISETTKPIIQDNAERIKVIKRHLKGDDGD